MTVRIEQKPSFRRVYKKLSARQRAEVENAIRTFIENPVLGEMKVADLAGILVYKFKTNRQAYLACLYV